MRAGDTLGFVVAVGIGVQNYRDTDLERTFWATFVLVAGTGALWMGLVTVEWLGIQGALVDSLSTSLQAIVVGVFAIGSIGTMAVVQDLKDSQRETERQRIEAEQAREEAEQLSAHLQKKASAFSVSMSRAADGDLTQHMNPESRSDAMSEIAEAFNDMMDELEGTFARIRTFADEVAASSEEVTGNRAPGLAQPRPTAAARSTTSRSTPRAGPRCPIRATRSRRLFERLLCHRIPRIALPSFRSTVRTWS